MSNTITYVTARNIIDNITHDAIDRIEYDTISEETTITFSNDSFLAASEESWDDEFTGENVNEYSWVIHNPGDDPRNHYVLSSHHSDDLRDAIIEHADTITTRPVHDVLTTTVVSDHGDSATVSWIPEEITGYDETKENIGMREWAWETVNEAPVHWFFDQALKSYLLQADILRFTGTHELVVTAHRVHHPNDLSPGTFWIHP